MIHDLQNLVSGKHICEEEEGGRTLAIITKNIYLVEKKIRTPVIMS